MEISQRDKKLLVYLLAVVIIAAAYFFGSRPFLDKQSALADENMRLTVKVNHCNDIYRTKDIYEEQIIDAQKAYNEACDKFFGGLDQENTFKLITGIENATNIWISRISFNEAEVMIAGDEDGNVQEVTANDVNPEDEPNSEASQGIQAYKQELNLEYSGSYNDFKKFIDYVQNFDKRLFISSISAAYSVDGDTVAGTVTVAQYAIIDSDKDYEAPEFPNISTGVKNIFSSVTGSENGGTGLEMQTLKAEDVENSDDTSESNDGESEETNEDTENFEEEDRPTSPGQRGREANLEAEEPAPAVNTKQPKTPGIL